MADGYTWALVGLSLTCTAASTAFLFAGYLHEANEAAAGAAWRSQRLFLRIGLSAPLLAALSAVALLAPGSALECELVQSLYEGYTLYLFFALLLLHLGGEVSRSVRRAGLSSLGHFHLQFASGGRG
jgi:hypothetical protein